MIEHNNEGQLPGEQQKSYYIISFNLHQLVEQEDIVLESRDVLQKQNIK